MDKHIKLVAIIQIVTSIIGLIVGTGLFFLLTSIGFFSQDDEAFIILSIVASVLGVFLWILSLPGLIGGIGLLKYKSWSRILLIIVSVIDLMNIPIGTIIGIYTLWVLMQDETIELLSK